MPTPPDPALLLRIRAELLAWYDAHRRELPWRAPPGQRSDPYHVWLSEVMLQQTRVETVIPYFARWLARFPTLARARRRAARRRARRLGGARLLLRARATCTAARTRGSGALRGKHPPGPEAFRALPGVGRYTAGAVMSIAFGRAEPIVDGNVRRAFARLTDDPAPTDAALWRLAAEVAPGERPGDLNQALMELGATLCTPRAPRCDACPAREYCAAHAAGTQAERPQPKRAKPLPHEDVAAAVIEHAGRWLLVRRPTDVRLGGMWEFPGTVRRRSESSAQAVERGAREGLGVVVRAGAELGAVKHAFSHLRTTYHAVRCEWRGGEPRALLFDAWAWVAPEELARHALPVAQKKIAVLAAEGRVGDVGR